MRNAVIKFCRLMSLLSSSTIHELICILRQVNFCDVHNLPIFYRSGDPLRVRVASAHGK